MKRITVILTLVLVVLAGVTFLVLQQQGETSSTGMTGELLVQYDSAAVDRITVQTRDGLVELQKEAGKWVLTSPLRYPADEGLVAQALGKGKQIELKGIVSSNPQKQQLFEVDSSGTLVRVYEKGAERAAFRVGKAGPSYTETYVRKEGSLDVHLADGMFGYFFTRQPKEWRDRTILKTDQASIRSVTLQFGDTTVALSLRDSLWRVDTALAADAAVRTFLGSVTNLQADGFVDEPPPALPPLVCTISLAGTDLRFFFAKESDKYYVLSSTSSQIFEIMSWRATQLLKRKKDFLG